MLIANREFTSRLVVGTGKYPSHEIMKAAHEASGTEMVTVAVRRVDLSATGAASLLSWIDRDRIFILPNTAGCYTADDAIRTARLAREAGYLAAVRGGGRMNTRRTDPYGLRRIKPEPGMTIAQLRRILFFERYLSIS